jgi:hypothetical protein
MFKVGLLIQVKTVYIYIGFVGFEKWGENKRKKKEKEKKA